MVCKDHLSPNPVVSISRKSKIIIVGQAPGRIVHETGIPWNDKSGDRLRDWLGIDKTTFYDTDKIGIMPMGFCYPGKGPGGDLPPRHECAIHWHEKILKLTIAPKLMILVGHYAQKYYLKDRSHSTITENIRNYLEFLPQFFVLPHPSPRNNIWMKKNQWFEQKVVPHLKNFVSGIIS